MTSYIFAVACATLLLYVHQTSAYDWGSASRACDTMMPKLSSSAKLMTDTTYFRVGATKETFYPGGKLYIRIKGRTSEDRYTYNGAMLTVVHSNPVGRWDEFHVDKYKRITCGKFQKSGILEANNRPKVVGDDVFVWNAPAECDFENPNYTLKATVIKNDREYLTGLTAELKCVPKPQTMEKMKMKDACMANYSMIPVQQTSFESNYGGWWNEPMAALRWTRHSGPTKSPKTGPSGAFDGRWYVYTETSYPAKENDVALLNGPVGLAGCFCVRLVCHMFTGPGTRFEFLVDGKVEFSHETPSDQWISAYQSVNTTEEVLVQLKLVRGVDFRGDLAMDHIRFTPGLCEEDIEQ